MTMLHRILVSLLAACALVAGGLAGAHAAPLKKKAGLHRAHKAARAAKARKTTNFRARRRVARFKKPRRKVNFTAGRKAPAAKPSRGKQVRLAALFGGASRLSADRNGRIYDASGRYLGKTIVPFRRKLKPGTVLVKTRERALYYVLPGGKAEKYGVGVGREGFTWSGVNRISMKKEWPEWRPPKEMIERELAKYGRKLPEVMPGGPKNPLGARALYIGSTLYRIHGTNNPRSIGKFVSSGCIRMVNDEVIELYDKVKVGAKVIVED